MEVSVYCIRDDCEGHTRQGFVSICHTINSSHALLVQLLRSRCSQRTSTRYLEIWHYMAYYNDVTRFLRNTERSSSMSAFNVWIRVFLTWKYTYILQAHLLPVDAHVTPRRSRSHETCRLLRLFGKQLVACYSEDEAGFAICIPSISDGFQ